MKLYEVSDNGLYPIDEMIAEGVLTEQSGTLPRDVVNDGPRWWVSDDTEAARIQVVSLTLADHFNEIKAAGLVDEEAGGFVAWGRADYLFEIAQLLNERETQ